MTPCIPATRFTVRRNDYARTRVGLFKITGENKAHRAAYVLAHGPIPTGMTIDHTCEHKDCIEPTHLEAVTRGENTRRYWRKRRRCPHGNEFSSKCNQCYAAAARKYRAKKG